MGHYFTRWKMPVLWGYMVKAYCRSLAICLFGIVALLLSTKIEEVARFIALGAPLTKITLFILYLIPYILQIAIPIASLVAGFVTLSQMSSNGEVTAARSSGYSISSLLMPIISCSVFFGVLMMWGMFDLSSSCHLAAKKLEYDVRDEEPLAFVQCSRFLADHGAALELTGSLRTGETAKDLLLCLKSPGSDRLSLVILKKAQSQQNALHGSALSIISSKPSPLPDHSFGSLLIENAEEKRTPTDYIHELTERKNWTVTADHMPLSVVRAKKIELQRASLVRKYQGHSGKKLTKDLSKFTSEPFRRFSLSLAVVTLALAGAVCGIRTSRMSRKITHIIGPLLAFGIFIASYLAGKNLDDVAAASIFFYLIPHPVLWQFSSLLKTRLDHGMEF